MKVNIEKLIEERLSYNIEGGKNWHDDLLEKHLNENKADFAIIEPSEFFNQSHYKRKESKLKEYYITGIYELGCIDPKVFHHAFKFNLFVFSKNRPYKIKICAAPQISFLKEEKKNPNIWAYYKDLEHFINDSKISENIKSLVNEIPSNLAYVVLHHLYR